MILDVYENYIEKIQTYIDKCFTDQKPYIKCGAGCSMCCEKGVYPISQLEFIYMLEGMKKLDLETYKKVMANVETAKETCNNPTNEKKYHQCPFLIDKKCCIYAHRALICRSYGLLLINENNNPAAPCCVDELNYSQVYDTEQRRISNEMFEESGIDVEPLAYNLSYKALQSNKYTDGLSFGETKALLTWFEQ